MKLMVSIFFCEGTFLFRQNKKTQHIFLIWFAFYSARGAENIFFLKKCCFEFGVSILCVLGMRFQELRDAYCMMVDLLI